MAEHNQLLSDEEIAKLQAKHTEHVCSMDQPPMSVLHIKSFVADVIAAHTAKLLGGVAGEVVAWMVPVENSFAPIMTNDVEQAKNWAMSGANVVELVPAAALAAARHELAEARREVEEQARLNGMGSEREAKLMGEAEECEKLRDQMSDLMRRTAIALRGPEPPLTSWSWHDLPERAAAAIAAIEVMTRAAQKLAAVPVHASDCALHNEPAYPAGECDCGAMSGQAGEVGK